MSIPCSLQEAAGRTLARTTFPWWHWRDLLPHDGGRLDFTLKSVLINPRGCYCGTASKWEVADCKVPHPLPNVQVYDNQNLYPTSIFTDGSVIILAKAVKSGIWWTWNQIEEVRLWESPMMPLVFFSVQRAKEYSVPKTVVKMKGDSGIKGLVSCLAHSR